MIVKNSKKEKNTVTFDVELDAAEFEKYVNGAYLKARSRIMVPGFRKGKAPRKVIEGMYGSKVFFEDAVNDVKTTQQDLEDKQYLLATGQIDDAHTVPIAAAQAQLSIDLLVQLRNKAIDAYNELMRISL